MQLKRTTCLIVLLLIIAVSANGQSAVLVMLKSERKKINHFASLGDKKNVKLVQQEAGKVIDATILDFSSNFRYCPVYYFMDTSLQMVLERKFAGVFFNDKREIFESSPLRGDDSNFVIVYYGIPPVDIKTKSNNENVYQAETYPSNGMVILGPNFERRPRKYDHYIYWPDLFFNVSRSFAFSSKIFVMEYKPYAGPLQSTLQSESKVKPSDYYWR